MCSAPKILVCVALVLASTLASEERKKRADYDNVSSNPWQSPTSWGFRPSNNYYNIPSTRISRVNNYNSYQSSGRDIQRNQVKNLGQLSELYNTREQSSGWVPINLNQQSYGGRYGFQRQQGGYSRVNGYNTINVEGQLLNGRTGQRQPSYLVQKTRGNQVIPQASRAIDGKQLIQSNQILPQRELYNNQNKGARDYLRQSINPLSNGESVPQPGRIIKSTYLSRVNPDQILGGNIQRENAGYPVQQNNQPIGELNQHTIRPFVGSNEFPVVEGRFLGVKETIPVVEPDQTDVEPNQQVNPNYLIRSYQLPAVPEQILGENVQQARQLPAVQEQILVENVQQAPAGHVVLQEINGPQKEINPQNLRAVNSEYLIETDQVTGEQGRNYAENIQREIPSRFVVQEINQPTEELKQSLRLVNPGNLRYRETEASQGQYLGNNIQQNEQQGQYLGNNIQQNEQHGQYLGNNIQLNEQQGQYLGNSIQQNEQQGQYLGHNIQQNEQQEQYLGNIQQNGQQGEYLGNNNQQNKQQSIYSQQIDSSSNNRRYPYTLALVNSKPIGSNQPSGVPRQVIDIVDQQYVQPSPRVVEQQNVPLNINTNGRFLQQTSKTLNSDSSVLSSQSQNGEWRQGRLSAVNELGNNKRSNGYVLRGRNPNFVSDAYQTQQGGNQNGVNQQPDVYSYAELTAKIWKVIKSNPAMMSNLQSLREQLLNGKNSRNEQMRELERLLREARKYNRNSAISATNAAGETLEQQKRDAFVNELIDTMNKNDANSNSANLRRQVLYNVNDGSSQARYVVRPSDVNPLIKDILFGTTKRNETVTPNTPSIPTATIGFRPSTNIPLPQLEVAEPFDLDQLEHYYDLTEWKRVAEALNRVPLLQHHKILEHLV